MKLPHVQLACRHFRIRTVRMTIDIHGTHTANTFTAIVVKGNRVLALDDKLVIQDINHLEKRGAL